jgi:hypothetical protein
MRCWNGANCEKTINYERIVNSYFIFHFVGSPSELSGNLKCVII